MMKNLIIFTIIMTFLLSACNESINKKDLNRAEVFKNNMEKSVNYSEDKNIVSFVTYNLDGNILQSPNRKYDKDTPILVFTPDSENFLFLWNNYGPFKLGETKPIKKSSGTVYMEEDLTIVFIYNFENDRGGILVDTQPRKISIDDANYEFFKKKYGLEKPGDNALID